MSELPALLQEQAERHWARLLPRLTADQLAALTPYQPQIMPLFALSNFIAESAIHSPDLLLSFAYSVGAALMKEEAGKKQEKYLQNGQVKE